MSSLGWKLIVGALVVIGLVLLVIIWLPGNGAVESGANTLHFGRILLGPDKTDDSKVIHFIVQGKDIYLDENKDNVPQQEELEYAKNFAAVEDEDAEATYQLSELRIGLAPAMVTDKLPQQLGMTVKISGDQPYTQVGSLVLARDSAASNWLHFHGPLQLLYLDEIGLHIGSEKPAELKLFFGSIAHGPATDICTSPDSGETMLSRATYVIPDDDTPFPKANIEYVSDGQPIVQELDLDTFC